MLPPSITEDHLALSRLESIPFDFQQSPGRAQLLRRAFSSTSPQTAVAMPGALRNREPDAGHVHSTSLSTAVCISLFLKQEE